MVALNPFFSLISFYEVEAGTQRWEIRVSMFAHRVIYGLNPAGGGLIPAGRPQRLLLPSGMLHLASPSAWINKIRDQIKD